MNTNIEIAGKSVYHSYPDDEKKHPGLIVIEEIWGVNDHIRSVSDRFAAEGYSVLSPELLPESFVNMITPELQRDLFDPEKQHDVQPKVRDAMAPIQQAEYAAATIATLKSCVDYLMSHEGVDGTVAVLGFCFGGTYAFHLAANDERIRAAVPFYGQAPSFEEVDRIHCPVLAFYGDKDERLMATLPQLKEDMKSASKDFEAVIYEGVGHAFFNDTNSRAYDATSAQDVWEKTLSFLQK
jgi:carboxymethylenebutenolidase